MVRGVKLTPSEVTARITIEQKLNYREVAVRARTTGQPARGYYVSSVEVSPATVTVVGPPAIIADMPGLISTLGEIDVTGETRMLVKRVPLDLPAGVHARRTDAPRCWSPWASTLIMSGMTVEVPLEMRKTPGGPHGQAVGARGRRLSSPARRCCSMSCRSTCWRPTST